MADLHGNCKFCGHAKVWHENPAKGYGGKTGRCRRREEGTDCTCRFYKCGCDLCEAGVPEVDWEQAGRYAAPAWGPPPPVPPEEQNDDQPPSKEPEKVDVTDWQPPEHPEDVEF